MFSVLRPIGIPFFFLPAALSFHQLFSKPLTSLSSGHRITLSPGPLGLCCLVALILEDLAVLLHCCCWSSGCSPSLVDLFFQTATGLMTLNIFTGIELYFAACSCQRHPPRRHLRPVVVQEQITFQAFPVDPLMSSTTMVGKLVVIHVHDVAE
jgi:hypothetical protein